jgi:hypothetical protein
MRLARAAHGDFTLPEKSSSFRFSLGHLASLKRILSNGGSGAFCFAPGRRLPGVFNIFTHGG